MFIKEGKGGVKYIEIFIYENLYVNQALLEHMIQAKDDNPSLFSNGCEIFLSFSLNLCSMPTSKRVVWQSTGYNHP